MAIDSRLRQELIRELGPHLQSTAARRYFLDLAFGAESFRSKLPAEDTSASGQNYAGELIAALDSRYQRTDEDDRYTLVLLLDTMAGDLSGGPSRRLQALATRVQRYYDAPPLPDTRPAEHSATQSPVADQTAPHVADAQPDHAPALPPSAEYEACLREAEQAATRQMQRLGLALALFIVVVIVVLALGWAVLAPVLDAISLVVGLLSVLVGLIFYLRTNHLPTIDGLRDWLTERERLECEEVRDGGGGAADEQSTTSRSTPPTSPDVPAAPAIMGDGHRSDELRFLQYRLELPTFETSDVWTTLSGRSRPVMRHRFTQHPEFATDPYRASHEEPHQFEDIVAEIRNIPRAVLVGEPGSGKTTTLRKVEVDSIQRALDEPQAQIPLFIALKEWRDSKQPFWSFVQSQTTQLADHLVRLQSSGRLQLLLDGLDQMPSEQRQSKMLEIKQWLADNPRFPALLSCRRADLGETKLGVDLIEIEPLSPSRIQEYIENYLKEEDVVEAEQLFWQIAGGDEVRGVWQSWQRAGASLDQFWSATEIPRQKPNVYGVTTGAEDTIWREKVRTPASLMRLAGNPYMLLMMIDIYEDEQGALPSNRGALFERFVIRLLAREDLVERDPLTEKSTLSTEGRALRSALAELAFGMLEEQSGDQGAVISLAEADVVPHYLSAGQFQLARGASILATDDPVSFAHQLLQEYFAATKLDEERKAGRVAASDLWPADAWWERTGWEETTILMAGLYSDDCTPVLQWLYEAHPEITAECVARSGAETAPETLELLRQAWKARLTDTGREPHPYARAAVGRALAVAGLDDREGVGVDEHGLPDIVWIEVEGGEYEIGGDEGAYSPLTKQSVTLLPFQMARYLITNAQWAAFLDDEEGYESEAWWEGLEKPEQPSQPRWSYSNHPREMVTWHEAVAFCRWLTVQKRRAGAIGANEEIRLPRETEWEAAARGKEGWIYPWGGDEYESGRANINERDAGPYYLQQTSAVGAYPSGDTSEGISDLSGNVWEWTASKYEEGEVYITLRGGSWFDFPLSARAASRHWFNPRNRSFYRGFRVILAPLSRADR